MICIVKDCMNFTHRGFRKCLECLRGNTPDKRGEEEWNNINMDIIDWRKRMKNWKNNCRNYRNSLINYGMYQQQVVSIERRTKNELRRSKKINGYGKE